MSCMVKLTIHAESTAWGETIGVAGSLPQLSAWGTTAPPSMTASPFPTWTLSLTLPAETQVHYKYVVLSSSEIARWEVLPESDENRSFTTPAPGETLEIDDGIMGDSARQSATVTPSTTPVTTPTKPKDPQKSITITTSTTTTTESPEPSAKHDHPLAELAAQLDNSRRQVEHVRAAVRHIRRIPTPDALPTPPSTPDPQTDLSPDSAAALTNDTLSEAKAHVEVIREKLRSARNSKSKISECGSSSVTLAGLLSFAVALLGVCILIVDPRIGTHLRQAVINGGEMMTARVKGLWEVMTVRVKGLWEVMNVRVKGLWEVMNVRVKGLWEVGTTYAKSFVVTGRDWGEKVKTESEEVVDRAITGAKTVEHPRLQSLWEAVAGVKRVCREAGSGLMETLRKVGSQVKQFRAS